MKLRHLLLLLLLVSVPWRIAEAQPSGRDAAARKSARPFAEKGFELFKAGEYAESIEQFERAEARYHAPPHLMYIARGYDRLDQLMEAREVYRQIVAERIDKDAPQAFHHAQVEAQADIVEITKRIPRIALALSGTEPDLVTITVDGRALDEVPELIELNPGEYTIEASAPDAAPVSHTVTLEPGDREQLSFHLQVTREDDSSLFLPAVVCFGVGGLGLLIGTITGGVSLDQAGDIDAQCVDDHCPPELESDADDAKAVGHVSTVSFVIAGLAAAAGVTLLLLDQDEGADTASLRLRVSPGMVGLDARF